MVGSAMSERTVNWLIYTCLLGLIPVIARLVVWAVSNEPIDPFAVVDMVAFGLVIHSSNINEVNRLKDEDERWKSVHNGTSILFIVVYALLFFAGISSPKNFNLESVTNITIFLSIVSFCLGLSILTRSNYADRARA